ILSVWVDAVQMTSSPGQAVSLVPRLTTPHARGVPGEILSTRRGETPAARPCTGPSGHGPSARVALPTITRARSSARGLIGRPLALAGRRNQCPVLHKTLTD